MTPEYQDFLNSKVPAVQMTGIEPSRLSGHLFTHQANAVDFALRAGRSGQFLDTGLGKTAVELEFCEHGREATNGKAIILAPLAVAPQIAKEGLRFGYDARVVQNQDEVREGINIVNYDRMHLIDPHAFGAVALDESSILKSFGGKTSRALIEAFSDTRFRLAGTATPAPNDHMELGQHSDFLGIMPSQEMLMRWFINDTSTASHQWRLKQHATDSFWNWMVSWSRMAMMPSDLGGSDEGFILPPLTVIPHHIPNGDLSLSGLVGGPRMSATELHASKRKTSPVRARHVADLIGSDSEPWVIWVDTDYEADALREAYPDAVEVRGSHPTELKEKRLAQFADGSIRKLLTKTSICGYGLNWQHCNRTAFMGRSFSYEAWYQAIRRFWRFGQMRPVEAHLFESDEERSVGPVIDRKAADHDRMKYAMAAAMRRAMSQSAELKIAYEPRMNAALPNWMSAA